MIDGFSVSKHFGYADKQCVPNVYRKAAASRTHMWLCMEESVSLDRALQGIQHATAAQCCLLKITIISFVISWMAK